MVVRESGKAQSWAKHKNHPVIDYSSWPKSFLLPYYLGERQKTHQCCRAKSPKVVCTMLLASNIQTSETNSFSKIFHPHLSIFHQKNVGIQQSSPPRAKDTLWWLPAAREELVIICPERKFAPYNSDAQHSRPASGTRKIRTKRLRQGGYPYHWPPLLHGRDARPASPELHGW